MVVDDDPLMRELLSELLAGAGWSVQPVGDGDRAIRTIEASHPDVIVLDVDLPGLDGFTVLEQLRADSRTRLLPVVLLTGAADVADRERGLLLGADDYFTKPFEARELLARLDALVRTKATVDRLEEPIRVALALAAAVGERDRYTLLHSQRVARMAWHLGRAGGISGQELDDLYRAALLHDVGKIAISDAILLKPGPLTTLESELMRTHVEVGTRIVAELAGGRFLVPAVRHHHERVDGFGYPDGLAGDRIPLAARMVAICDAFDAMLWDRPYGQGRSFEEVGATLVAGSGTQWDAGLVRLFLASVSGRAGLLEPPSRQDPADLASATS